MQEFKEIEDRRDGVFAIGASLFRIEDLCNSIENFLRSQVQTGLNSKLNTVGQPPIRDQWLIGAGVSGQVMTPQSNGWMTGTVRIRVAVEFAPNPSAPSKPKSVSELDEIRNEEIA